MSTPVQVFNVNGTPYYMVSHYEKQYYQSGVPFPGSKNGESSEKDYKRKRV